MTESMKSAQTAETVRRVVVRIAETIPGTWHEEIKRLLVGKKFTAREVVIGGVSSIRVNGDVFLQELREQDPKLHDQLLRYDPQLAGVAELKFRPSWVKIVKELTNKG